MKEINIILVLTIIFISLNSFYSVYENIEEIRIDKNFEAKDINKRVQKLESAQYCFAFKLLKVLNENKHDVLLSPVGLYYSLLNLYLASDGNTKAELANLLCLADTLKYSFSDISKFTLKSDSNKYDGFDLNVKTSFWCSNNFSYKKEFIEKLDEYDISELHLLDFVKQPELSSRKINDWASSNSNGKINKIITPESINENTKLLLLNIVYFSSSWHTPFDPNKTRKDTFFDYNKNNNKIEFLNCLSTYDYFDEGSFQIIRIPYSQSEFNLYILLPAKQENLTFFIENINYRTLGAIENKMQNTYVNLYLPKIEFANSLNLEDAIKSLGVHSIFSQAANFTNLTLDNVFVKSIIQSSNFSLNEAGTEASAATSIVISTAGAINKQIPIVDFIANRPFLFYIKNERSNSILFLSKISNLNNLNHHE